MLAHADVSEETEATDTVPLVVTYADVMLTYAGVLTYADVSEETVAHTLYLCVSRMLT